MPYSANLTLRQIDLTLLLAGIGINSGHTFLSTISDGCGGFIVLLSVFISIMTAIITLVIGAKLIKIPFSFLTGMVANQPAILDFAVDRATNKLPNIGFITILSGIGPERISCLSACQTGQINSPMLTDGVS